MATYYVDDGGDGTTENSWATADTSINALDTEYTFASGDIVYFGHDMQCQATNTANLTITGPSSGAPVLFISATQGSSPPAYQASTTNQIDTTENPNYNISFDGSFALYGMKVVSGGNMSFIADSDELFSAYGCTLSVGAGKTFEPSGVAQGRVLIEKCTIDLRDTGNTAAIPVNITTAGLAELIDCTFNNASYRTAYVFYLSANYVNVIVSGCDLSGFTNATACELIENGTSSAIVMTNCLTAATWTPMTTSYPSSYGYTMLTNVGPADAPTYLNFRNFFGDVISSSAIYRTNGASIEGTSCSWLITTRATYACESHSFKCPWIYGNIGSTGSKTFDLYITNDTADFTDAEVWLEIEYLGTTDEAQTSESSDWRHNPSTSTYITTTAAAQTDDTTSTWNGTGPNFTYKQKLSVTATVNETGQFRARVCVGVANIASSRYFYVDPKVTVS